MTKTPDPADDAGAGAIAAVATAHAADGHEHGGGGAHAIEPTLPAEINTGTAIDGRFLNGTRGPVVEEGDAPTVKIPDGPGFDGGEGRVQNNDDKQQNNYSVTDANFNPALGLLKKNPDTGEQLNYNEHTATYNAAGYLKSTAEYYASKGDDKYLTEYNKIVANQNDGKGTILGAAGKVTGLFESDDPALAGVDAKLLGSMGIPGSDRDPKEYVRSSEDVTGQEWARMHHPESSWDMYYSMVDLGVDSETALKFSGDDGVSGSGRLNGYNNQDGANSFNGGEVQIWAEAARYQQRTGIPVIQAMMSGHDHTGLSEGAKTLPEANQLLGLDLGDRSASPERVAAVTAGLLDGTLSEANNNGLRRGRGAGGGAGNGVGQGGSGGGVAQFAAGGALGVRQAGTGSGAGAGGVVQSALFGGAGSAFASFGASPKLAVQQGVVQQSGVQQGGFLGLAGGGASNPFSASGFMQLIAPQIADKLAEVANGDPQIEQYLAMMMQFMFGSAGGGGQGAATAAMAAVQGASLTGASQAPAPAAAPAAVPTQVPTQATGSLPATPAQTAPVEPKQTGLGTGSATGQILLGTLTSPAAGVAPGKATTSV